MVLFGSQAGVIQHVFEKLWRPENQTVLGFRVRAPWPTLAGVDETTGLMAGDRLTAVVGEPFDGTVQLDRAMATRFPGGPDHSDGEPRRGVARGELAAGEE